MNSLSVNVKPALGKLGNSKNQFTVCFCGKRSCCYIPLFGSPPVFTKKHLKPLGISHAEKGLKFSISKVSSKWCITRCRTNEELFQFLQARVTGLCRRLRIQKRWDQKMGHLFFMEKMGKNSQKIGNFSGFICGFLAFWPNTSKGSRNSKKNPPTLPPKLKAKFVWPPPFPWRRSTTEETDFCQAHLFPCLDIPVSPPSAYQSSTWRIIPIS